MHQLKEVDMLSAKMDLLMKRLNEGASKKNEVMHIHDSCMICEECGETGHSGNNCPKLQEDANYINNNNYYYYHPQQNQGWNQQQRPNYLGNYQGNNSFNNFNQPPLRELVLNQGKLMDNLSKKLASNDKVLETINNRMDSFSNAIKNQHSFNKMIESQISQLATVVPPTNQGKIHGQPEELESANLEDIFNAGSYWSDPSTRGWNDESLPIKKGDPGRPVIPISIGSVNFHEVICDFGASVNIMPKVIYKRMFNYPLLYTTMCLQLTDQSLCHAKGILEDICV
jgi:hypothetical protein